VTNNCPFFKGCPVLKANELKPPISPPNSPTARLVDTALYRYAGNSTCCFLKRDILTVLETVFTDVMKTVPGTKRFILGNASPLYGVCPENDSHKELRCLDIDYPTYSGNGTQYGGREEIWSDGDQYSMVLDESKINWKALWQLIVRLSKHCKVNANGMFDQQESQIIVHTKMFQLIEKHIVFNDMVYLNGVVSQDSSTGLNHHTHIHLKIRLT
jgi:hypothetical protein